MKHYLIFSKAPLQAIEAKNYFKEYESVSFFSSEYVLSCAEEMEDWLSYLFED